MSATEEIRRRIRELHRRNNSPGRIEIGEKQARTLAEEFNAMLVRPKFDPVLVAHSGIAIEEDETPPITWQQIMQGPSKLYGVSIVGVESPDYLTVVPRDEDIDIR